MNLLKIFEQYDFPVNQCAMGEVRALTDAHDGPIAKVHLSNKTTRTGLLVYPLQLEPKVCDDKCSVSLNSVSTRL